MKTLKTIILFLVLSQFSWAQEGVYFGDQYTCIDISRYVNQFFWIDLKENKTFNYQIIFIDKEIECLKMEGKWEIKNDTLYLTTDKNEEYFYLISNDTIKTPNENLYLNMALEENSGIKKDIKNRGVDNFGFGIREMIKMDALPRKTKREKQKIINRLSNHSSCN